MNFLVFCCDSFRADHLGCYGNARVQTPHLDALAREGVVFENFFAEALPTLNARSVFFTGRHQFPGWQVRRHKGDELSFQPGWHALDEEDETLAERFDEAGWTTGLIADLYHYFKPTGNFHRGFGSWEWIRGQEADPWKAGPDEAIDLLPYMPRDIAEDRKRPHWLRSYLRNTASRRREEDYFAPRVIRAAIEWLRANARRREPFFLWLDLFDPHEPWDPPKAYADAYAPPADIEYILPIFNNASDYTPAQLQRLRALYAGEITFVDAWIGKALAALEELGAAGDTAVVFTADHGTILGEYGRVKKAPWTLTGIETRLPLIVRLPGKEHAGARVAPLAHAPDLAPSLLRLAGLEPSVRATGRDFMPLVEGRIERLHDFVVSAYGEYAAWRDERHCLIAPAAETPYGARPPINPRPQLYDLQKDPEELRDIALEQPDIAERLRAQLDGYIRGGGFRREAD